MDGHYISKSIKKFRDALPILEKVVKGLGNENISSELSVEVGELCFNLGLYSDASCFFEKTLASNPKNYDALNNLGVLSFQAGDYHVARDYFIRTLEVQPDNKEALSNLASVTEMENKSSFLSTKTETDMQSHITNQANANDKTGNMQNIHTRIHALLSYCDSNGFEGISQSNLFKQGVKGFNFTGSVRTQVHILPGHDFFLKMCLERAGDNILDMGCGTGNLGMFLKKHKLPKPEYFGIDGAEDRIAVLREQLNLQGMCGNILEFYPDLVGRFNTIILNQVVEHLELNEVKELFEACKQYRVKNILISTPSIEQLPLLAYYNIIPESLTYANHKTFWTRKMLDALLNNSFQGAKNIEVGEFNESFPFISDVRSYYHLYADIAL